MHANCTVHMIGQAHLDPVWLWRWTEGRAEALATSQSAVDRLAESPDFHFTRGEAQVYAWIEAENPALFAQIKALIDAGRWHVVNGMVIQPDMNLPGGESFVRQVLLGKRWMREHLGVEPRIAYCVDSFGHAGTLPQILRQCGFDAYVFMRPSPHEKELPANVFWWQGPDGSRLLTFRIAGAYTTRSVDQEAHILHAVAAKPDELDATMCFFGVGNHGGGPTRTQIENVRAVAAAHPELDIRFSHPEAFFAAIAGQTGALPSIADELQFHAVGCYSVNSALKRAHRQAENRLLVAERLAVLAQQWAATPYPHHRLDELWHTLCFNQFHDTLGGSSIKAAEDDAIAALAGVESAAAALIDDAGRQIAARIDTRGDGGVVVLFNPHGHDADSYVEYEPWTDWEPWDEGGWGLLDEAGAPVAWQLIESHQALTPEKGGIHRLLCRVRVPALGYRTLRYARHAPQPALPESGARATAATLENDLIAAHFDPATGNLISCIDKKTGVEYTGAGGWNVGQVLEDTSDTWSHGVQRFEHVIGAFGNARITVGDRGPLQASLLIERSYGANHWQQEVILRRGERALTIRNWLLWQEAWRMVKLAFDVDTPAPQATHDIPFGWIVRPCDGSEFPTHMWMDVSGPDADGAQLGAALLNDGKYGCDVTGSTMRLTILRCVPYAYHKPPHTFGLRRRYDWVDQGAQEFTVVVCPHGGDWRDAGVVEQARLLNQPLVAITHHAHAGDRPRQESLASLDAADIELTALKRADDGHGVIVRVADMHGRSSAGMLRWQNQTFPIEIAPFQVATFRLTEDDGCWQMAACDMLER
ncbi:MAG: alpha-mannosidase [Caldilineaceae bacterium]|nr:alpha-mannosidase [Caldilineaceae bacterium]